MGKLFYINEKRQAEPVKETLYDKEADLQKIVAENPYLLARDWDVAGGRKLYLVNQEQSVLISEEDGNTYSLDHLLVDDEGIPVLVEVKRRKDTRIRREVVAQMLDYACGAMNWDITTLKWMFKNNNPSYSELFDDDFWGKVEENLRAGKMRLVFVADSIPETLRVLIEFMDKAMQNIEVYGVELKPYRTDGVELLSKTIIGNSLLSNPKPETTRMNWTYDLFLQQMDKCGVSDLKKTLEDLVNYATDDLNLEVIPGGGAVSPSIVLKTDNVSVAYVYLRVNKAKGNSCSIEFSIPDLANYCRVAPSEITAVLNNYPEMGETSRKQLIWRTENWNHIDLRTLQTENGIGRFKENLANLVDMIGDSSGVWHEEDMISALNSAYGDWGVDFYDRVKRLADEEGYTGKYSYNRNYIPYRFCYNGIHVFNFTAKNEWGSLAFNSDTVGLTKEQLIDRICEIDPKALSYNNPEKRFVTLRYGSIKDNHKEEQTLELLRDIKPKMKDF